MARMMPWDFIEDIYLESMSQENGAKALSARIAFGAIYIKEHENLADERTVEYIAENPYMQYFLGLREYTDTPLFDPSMMVHFRKRFSAAQIEEINKRMFIEEKAEPPDDKPQQPNSGKLVLDATCAPADIRYPSDLSLLNEARENTEKIIETLWPHCQGKGHKTRYSRKKARKQYLVITKQKKPKGTKTRGAIGKQLEYIRRNLEDIGKMRSKSIGKSWLGYLLGYFLLLKENRSKQKPLKPLRFKGFPMELMMGLEPMTSSLPRKCSTS